MSIVDPTNLDRLKQVMEEGIPFNLVLGIKVEELRRGYARARIPFKASLIGDPTRPAIHGGVLASFADAVAGAAVFSKLQAGENCSTVDLRIDFLRPGREQDIICEAEVLRLGSQVAVTSVRLYQDDGKDIAVSKAVFMVHRGRPSLTS